MQKIVFKSFIFLYFNRKVSTKEMLEALLEPSCVKPFVILVIYFMLYQFSGVNTITFYAVEIFRGINTTYTTEFIRI